MYSRSVTKSSSTSPNSVDKPADLRDRVCSLHSFSTPCLANPLWNSSAPTRYRNLLLKSTSKPDSAYAGPVERCWRPGLVRFHVLWPQTAMMRFLFQDWQLYKERRGLLPVPRGGGLFTGVCVCVCLLLGNPKLVLLQLKSAARWNGKKHRCGCGEI